MTNLTILAQYWIITHGVQSDNLWPLRNFELKHDIVLSRSRLSPAVDCPPGQVTHFCFFLFNI